MCMHRAMLEGGPQGNSSICHWDLSWSFNLCKKRTDKHNASRSFSPFLPGLQIAHHWSASIGSMVNFIVGTRENRLSRLSGSRVPGRLEISVAWSINGGTSLTTNIFFFLDNPIESVCFALNSIRTATPRKSRQESERDKDVEREREREWEGSEREREIERRREKEREI